MAKYVCTEKCYHNKLYRKGDYAFFDKPETAPNNKDGDVIHFELIDEPIKPAKVVDDPEFKVVEAGIYSGVRVNKKKK